MEIGFLVMAAANCKKAIDVMCTVKSYQAMPPEGVYLLDALDAVRVPLGTAVKLQCRHTTQPYVDAAVRMTQRALVACETAIQMDEGEEPTDDKSWKLWLERAPKSAKAKVARKDTFPQLVHRLGVCMSALQLALTALMADLPSVEFAPTRPFSHLQTAEDAAVKIIHLFEMGRLASCGDRYLLCAGAYWRNGSLMMPSCVVWLHNDSAKKVPWSLRIVAQGGDASESGTEHVPLAATTTVEREVFALGERLSYAVDKGHRIDFGPATSPPEGCFPEGEGFVPVTAEVWELLLMICVEMARKGVDAVADALTEDDRSQWLDRLAATLYK